jgi:hypothetical protein
MSHFISSPISGAIRCPVCQQVTPSSGMIDNLFVVPPEGAQKEPAGPSDKGDSGPQQICTSCEEGTVTHFCEECNDWLCMECVEAHRRVRITKDHHVQPKDSVSQNNMTNAESGSGFEKCPIHPMEPLKLFCDTCDRLTCRDCQLTSHKDHKYEFLDEAAQNYKYYLQELLKKVREKQTYVNNAKTLIEKRSQDISKKEERVVQNIKQFTMKLITEIQRGASLCWLICKPSQKQKLVSSKKRALP